MSMSALDNSLPELQHNVRLLVEFAEAEIQAVYIYIYIFSFMGLFISVHFSIERERKDN